MIIGFTAETSSFEKRVAVTPEAAVGYIRAGFAVYAFTTQTADKGDGIS